MRTSVLADLLAPNTLAPRGLRVRRAKRGAAMAAEVAQISGISEISEASYLLGRDPLAPHSLEKTITANAIPRLSSWNLWSA